MAKALLVLIVIAAAALAVPVAPTPIATGAPMPSGLIAQLHFDEGQGMTAADATGKANDGTFKGAAIWCQGNWGTAAGLDGIGAYVDLGTSVTMNLPAGGFTISAWVNTTDLYGPIVALRHPSNNIQVSLSVGYDGSTSVAGKLMALVRKDGGSSFARVTGATINDGAWHHVAVTKDATTTIELFIDGVSQGTNAHADASGTFTPTQRSIGTDLRWNANGAGDDDKRWLAGGVEEVQVYTRQLPLADLQALAVKTAPDPKWTAPGPVGWWKGDDGASPSPSPAASAADSSGYNHPGKYTSGATTAAPAQASLGGNSMSFDGVDDYVNADTFTWPAQGGPVTVAYWEYIAAADLPLSKSSWGVGNDGTNRLQAHSPYYQDHLLYWDYGGVDTAARITADYGAYMDKWTHVVLISAGNGGSYKAIYLDGILVASSMGASKGPATTLTGLTIGKWTLSNNTFKGKIDDFRIYDRMLTSAEIDALTDIVPPAVVTIGAAGASHDSVTLTWTSPGDDGVVGTATTYNLCYSGLKSIDNESEFSSATPVAGLPTPLPGGSTQTVTVNGLAEQHAYWFALKTSDNARNWSPRSASLAVSTSADTAPDATVLTVVETTPTSIALSWISAGDDGMAGSATACDLRFSTSAAISGETEFQAATPVTGITPAAAGTVQTFTVTGLKKNTLHHFALKTGDATAHWSALSNSARAGTFSAGSNGTSLSDAVGSLSCGASAGSGPTALLLLLTAVTASVILRRCSSPR